MPNDKFAAISIWRRRLVKVFVVVFVLAVALDTAPVGIDCPEGRPVFVFRAKVMLRPYLKVLGLWQAEWKLFAPDPVICNNWWDHGGAWRTGRSSHCARPCDRSDWPGRSVTWSSPYWGEISAATKTWKRRHVAYLRRMGEFPRMVCRDYMDYLLRSPAVR